jgi:hypothetical protein
MANCAVTAEVRCMARDFQLLAAEYGASCRVILRPEADVSRDGYGGIKKKSLPVTIDTYALPVERAPSERKLRALGLREDIDCAVTTPILDWVGYVSLDDLGATFAAVDMNRMTVQVDGRDWKVADKALTSRYGDGALAITLGLKGN